MIYNNMNTDLFIPLINIINKYTKFVYKFMTSENLNSPAVEALGKIYEYMVLKRELELENRKHEKNLKDKETKEQNELERDRV